MDTLALEKGLLHIQSMRLRCKEAASRIRDTANLIEAHSEARRVAAAKRLEEAEGDDLIIAQAEYLAAVDDQRKAQQVRSVAKRDMVRLA